MDFSAATRAEEELLLKLTEGVDEEVLLKLLRQLRMLSRVCNGSQVL